MFDQLRRIPFLPTPPKWTSSSCTRWLNDLHSRGQLVLREGDLADSLYVVLDIELPRTFAASPDEARKKIDNFAMQAVVMAEV